MCGLATFATRRTGYSIAGKASEGLQAPGPVAQLATGVCYYGDFGPQAGTSTDDIGSRFVSKNAFALAC